MLTGKTVSKSIYNPPGDSIFLPSPIIGIIAAIVEAWIWPTRTPVIKPTEPEIESKR
jgi:hypothetical protein